MNNTLRSQDVQFKSSIALAAYELILVLGTFEAFLNLKRPILKVYYCPI